MKLFIATMATLLITGNAHAWHQYATDAELNEAVNNLTESIRSNTLESESGTSVASALASIPQRDGNSIGMGLAKYGSGRALALGYSGGNEKFSYRAGVSMGNRDEAAFGAGFSYGF